jgi:hypothetical protein
MLGSRTPREPRWSVFIKDDRIVVEKFIRVRVSEVRDNYWHIADYVLEQFHNRFFPRPRFRYLWKPWVKWGQRRARRALIKIFKEFVRRYDGEDRSGS